jgi:hypothetical protein
MGMSVRAFLRSTLLVVLTAGTMAPGAVAGSVSSYFGGTVEGALAGDSYPGNVAFGDAINGSVSSFVYNTANVKSGSVLNPVYVFTDTASGQGLNIQVTTPTVTPPNVATNFWSDSYNGGTSTSTSATFQITMAKSTTGGVTTTTMTIYASTNGGPTEATEKSNAFMTLVLASTTYTGGLALPTASGSTPSTASISAFLNIPAQLTWDPNPIGAQQGGGQGFGGYINNFNGQSVPEPSSFILMGVALATGGCVLAISRRRLPKTA